MIVGFRVEGSTLFDPVAQLIFPGINLLQWYILSNVPELGT